MSGRAFTTLPDLLVNDAATQSTGAQSNGLPGISSTAKVASPPPIDVQGSIRVKPVC
jgi:hypothetical protein